MWERLASRRGNKKKKKENLTFQLRSLPLRGGTVGESGAGPASVGEFSFSSLKLKLFLYSESAPFEQREHTR